MGGRLKRWQEPFTLSLAAAGLVLLVAPPLIAVTGEVISSASQAFAAVAQPRLMGLLLQSLALATAVTAIAVAVGVPLGLLLAQARPRFCVGLLFLHSLPLFLPPFLTALALFHLFGRTGWVGSQITSAWLFSPAGTIIVLALCFTPVVTNLTWLGVRTLDATLVEAARTAAGPWQTAREVVLPQAAPAIALAAIIVFALTLAEIAVPMFLRVDVYASAVFARLGGFDFAPGEAAALTAPLVLITVLLWALERKSRAHRVVALPRTGGGHSPSLPAPQVLIARVAGVIAAALGVLPVLVLAVVAVRGTTVSELLAWVGTAPRASLGLASTVATCVLALASVLALAVRDRPRLGTWIDGAAWLGFLIPPAVLAIGTMVVWNRPSTQWLYGSPAILVLVLAARYAALGHRTVLAGVRSLAPSYGEAARTSGASYWRALRGVHWPLLLPSLVGSWLLVFAFCLRDIETAALLYPPGSEPLTVRLFTLDANGPPAVVAGLAVVQALLTVVPLALAMLIWSARR